MMMKLFSILQAPFTDNTTIPVDAARSPARLALQRLMLLRALVCLVAVSGALVFNAISPLQIPPVLIPGMLVAVMLSVVIVIWRLQKPWLISRHELFLHLLTDVAFLLIILVYTGGASNPLISYLLVLLAVAATLLTQMYVSIFALMAIAIYSLFLVADLQSEPDALHAGMAHDQAGMENFQLHLVGMWVTFVVSAILITLFVTRMAAAIRVREVALAKGRENEMRNEQLVAIGTLAAGTAHALGTPLSTMAVLLNDLDKESEESLKQLSLKADISLLKQQVVRCKASLDQLTRFYNKSDSDAPATISLGNLQHEIRDYIVNIHPRANVHFSVETGSETVLVSSDPSLKHAVINIVENAIKAARAQVSVKFSAPVDSRIAEVCIQDDGPGIPAHVMENLGEPFISTRKESMGLGIFLANAALQRLGGSIEILNLNEGGAMSIIRFPVPTDIPLTF